jgi:hypothetical protein
MEAFMWNRRNYEQLNIRCEKLEALGFSIMHEDSHVHYYIDGQPIDIDFSAVDENKFMEYAIKKIHEDGQIKGRNQIRSSFHKLMDMEREDEE